MKSILLALSFIMMSSSYALESAYDVSVKDSPEAIKKKLKDADVEKNKDFLSISFSSPQSFTPSPKDLFELIESHSTNDRPMQKVVVADPATGRIFHLNNELKLLTLDLLEPWKSKARLKSMKVILNELKNPKLEKKK